MRSQEQFTLGSRFIFNSLQCFEIALIYYYLFFFFLVSSGSVTINEDSTVQVLAQVAVPLDRLDPQVSFRRSLTIFFPHIF